jgi:hypothetical protein
LGDALNGTSALERRRATARRALDKPAPDFNGVADVELTARAAGTAFANPRCPVAAVPRGSDGVDAAAMTGCASRVAE